MNTRQIAGAKANLNGRSFENYFYAVAVNSGIAATRMPDGCVVYGKNRLRRTKTAFDWILSHRSRSVLVDTKAIAGRAFPYSGVNFAQVSELCRHADAGVSAGYVVDLRGADTVIFIPAHTLIQAVNKRGSFEPGPPAIIGLGSSTTFDLTRLFMT